MSTVEGVGIFPGTNKCVAHALIIVRMNVILRMQIILLLITLSLYSLNYPFYLYEIIGCTLYYVVC